MKRKMHHFLNRQKDKGYYMNLRFQNLQFTKATISFIHLHLESQKIMNKNTNKRQSLIY